MVQNLTVAYRSRVSKEELKPEQGRKLLFFFVLNFVSMK